jgi:serine/threonine protein kinase
MPFEEGTRPGPYEIIAPLGAGGMGEVCRTRDTRLDRTVAVKALTGTLAADSASRRRFEDEARAIVALNDPLIRTLHDVDRGEKDCERRWQSIGDVICGTQVRSSGDRSSVDAAATVSGASIGA